MRKIRLDLQKYLRLSGFLIALLSGDVLFAQPPSKDYQLLFEDNFDGSSIRENGIRQETKDVSTAGRLGDVGEQLQVIADVFIPTKNEAPKDTGQQKTITRYKGNLQHIRVFNRAVTSDEILKFKN